LFCALVFGLPPAAFAERVVPQISARLEADEDRVFVYESFYLTLSIRSKGVRLSKSFHLEALPDESKLKRTNEFKELPPTRSVEGDEVRETRVFRCEARAMEPGPLIISPVLRVFIVSTVGSFFGYEEARTPRNIHVEPITLEVIGLPETNRPEDVSGAVGQFSFDAEVAPSDVVVGDLVTVVMTISGKGYLDAVSPPRISPGPDFKAYAPQSVPGTSESERIIKQTVIPMNTNAVEIPPVSFSFFDTGTSSYRTLTKGPFQLTFRTEARPSFQQYRPGLSAQSSREKSGLPIAGLKPAPDRWHRVCRGPWYASLIFLAVQPIPVIIILLVALRRRRRQMSMRGRHAAGLCVFLFAFRAFAYAAEQRPVVELPVSQSFRAGATAYDTGCPGRAVEIYEEILERGYVSAELFYNLANAHLKLDNHGFAILNYRRALTLAPRDSDIRSNLAVAMKRAHCPEHHSSRTARAISSLTDNEWAILALAAYWTGIALTVILPVARRRRKLVSTLVVMLAGVVLFSVYCAASRAGGIGAPEAVLTRQQNAKLAPGDSAMAILQLPEGSLVRIVDVSGNWAKVQCERRKGWLRRSALTRISHE